MRPRDAAMKAARRVRDWWADKGCIQHSDMLVDRIVKELRNAERRGRRRGSKA